jgi:hypothetical protein
MSRNDIEMNMEWDLTIDGEIEVSVVVDKDPENPVTLTSFVMTLDTFTEDLDEDCEAFVEGTDTALIEWEQFIHFLDDLREVVNEKVSDAYFRRQQARTQLAELIRKL